MSNHKELREKLGRAIFSAHSPTWAWEAGMAETTRETFREMADACLAVLQSEPVSESEILAAQDGWDEADNRTGGDIDSCWESAVRRSWLSLLGKPATDASTGEGEKL